MANTHALAKKRLFFALWPDEDVRAAIASGAAPAIKVAGSGAVSPANYHITLAFLGSVTVTSLPDLIATAGWVRFLPFEIDLKRTGYWPRSKVAWLAPAEISFQLPALVDDLWNKLADLGYQREDRQFMPHLTLGRMVDGGLGMQLDETVRWPVSSFVLVESTPGPAGPGYTVLEQFSAGA